LGNILKEKNVDFIHFDPYVDTTKPVFLKGTYFIATKHENFKEYDFPEESTIIDVWRYLNFEGKNINHIKVGNK
jgi:hypothetical protein